VKRNSAFTLRAARNNGVTPDEIRETLLHAAIYCGVPAANHAFKIAAEVLSNRGPEPQPAARRCIAVCALCG